MTTHYSSMRASTGPELGLGVLQVVSATVGRPAEIRARRDGMLEVLRPVAERAQAAGLDRGDAGVEDIPALCACRRTAAAVEARRAGGPLAPASARPLGRPPRPRRPSVRPASTRGSAWSLRPGYRYCHRCSRQPGGIDLVVPVAPSLARGAWHQAQPRGSRSHRPQACLRLARLRLSPRTG